MTTVTVFRRKHLAIFSSVCDVFLTMTDVTDDDDALATATDVCVVSPVSALATVSVATQHLSGRQGVHVQLRQQEIPTQLQRAYLSVIEIALRKLRPATWTEL